MSLYHVESIIDHRINPSNNKKQYRIKWQGYSVNQCTWQPIKHLKTVLPMVDRYQKKLQKKQTQLLKIHKKRVKTVQKQVQTQKQQKINDKRVLVSKDKAQLAVLFEEPKQNFQQLFSLNNSNKKEEDNKTQKTQQKHIKSDSEHENEDENENDDDIWSISDVTNFLPQQYMLNLQQKMRDKKAFKLRKNYHKLKHPVKIIGIWLDNRKKHKKNYIIKYRSDLIIYCHHEYIVNNYYKQLIEYLESKLNLYEENI